MCRAYQLPNKFHFSESKGRGQGCTQLSATDAIFNTMCAARLKKLREHGQEFRAYNESFYNIFDRLYCYTSSDAHYGVKKACKLAMLKLQLMRPHTNEGKFHISAEIYRKQLEADTATNRIPCYSLFTMGTASCCAFDEIPECARLCKSYGMWCHIDAAYAGNAFLLDSYANVAKALELCDSVNINPYKMILAAPDLAILWVDDAQEYIRQWLHDATYLIRIFGSSTDQEIHRNEIDYRNYGIPLTRRMRALKLWFVFRTYGMAAIKKHILNIRDNAATMESWIRKDHRFEMVRPVVLGLVCFRQKRLPDQTDDLYNKLHVNLLCRMLMHRTMRASLVYVNDEVMIRISMNSEYTNYAQTNRAWKWIAQCYVKSLDRSERVGIPIEPTPAIRSLMRTCLMEPVTHVPLPRSQHSGCVPVEYDDDIARMFEYHVEKRMNDEQQLDLEKFNDEADAAFKATDVVHLTDSGQVSVW